MTKLKGDIFKDHSDKLGLLWTNDQWQTVMNAMDEYAQQEVKNIVGQADVMQRSEQLLQKVVHQKRLQKLGITMKDGHSGIPTCLYLSVRGLAFFLFLK